MVKATFIMGTAAGGEVGTKDRYILKEHDFFISPLLTHLSHSYRQYNYQCCRDTSKIEN